MATGERPNSTPAALEWLRKHFSTESARDVRVGYRFELSGPGAAVIDVRIDDGRLGLGEGESAAADVVLRLAASDFFDILAGSANPDLLFMADRLEIDGDLSLALKLRTLFRSAG